MAKFRIKIPRSKNIDSIVQTFNSKKGQGIEIFYNIKKGKLFIAEYYKNYSDSKTRKVSVVCDDVHLSSISTEYLNDEIKKIGQNETESRIVEKQRQKEQLLRYKRQRREHLLRKYRLKT